MSLDWIGNVVSTVAIPEGLLEIGHLVQQSPPLHQFPNVPPNTLSPYQVYTSNPRERGSTNHYTQADMGANTAQMGSAAFVSGVSGGTIHAFEKTKYSDTEIDMLLKELSQRLSLENTIKSNGVELSVCTELRFTLSNGDVLKIDSMPDFINIEDLK